MAVALAGLARGAGAASVAAKAGCCRRRAQRSLPCCCACRLDEIVADLQARVEDGQVLYLHCWGGRGRAGLVGACFLAAAYK